MIYPKKIIKENGLVKIQMEARCKYCSNTLTGFVCEDLDEDSARAAAYNILHAEMTHLGWKDVNDYTRGYFALCPTHAHKY